jgi:hypothetical protein
LSVNSLLSGVFLLKRHLQKTLEKYCYFKLREASV